MAGITKESETLPPQPTRLRLRWVGQLTSWLVMLMVPVLLVLLSVRLVMTPLFLELEYNRPGFPEDRYGMTQAERLMYAPRVLNYLLNDAEISYLADMTFPDGRQMFNARELRHMVDVKVLTRAAYMLLLTGGLFTVVLSVVLMRYDHARWIIFNGLFNGAALTLGLIGAIVLMALLAWDTFFTGFHTLFFEAGTWRFAYSDTLIRLFPERFWFDAALTIGILTSIGAALILISTWRRGSLIKRLRAPITRA
ncbi:MAG: TIGR01906 family membrane protein [Chloroflexota bacterium]